MVQRPAHWFYLVSAGLPALTRSVSEVVLQRAFGGAVTESVTADRLLLASRVDCCLQLREPTFIAAGQTYWVEHETGELCVDRGSGRVTRHPGSRRPVSDQGGAMGL